MSRKAINLIIAAMMFVSSFSTLYVCVNITSLSKELNNYMQSVPFAPVIRVGGLLGNFAQVSAQIYNELNQVNNLVYYLAGEAQPSFHLDDAVPPVLTDTEVARIRALGDINTVFSFDDTDLIQHWTVRAPYGKGEFVYPLTPQYLEALHPPLKEGRYFEKGDPLNVILVRESYVKNLVRGPEVLGKKVTVYTHPGTEQFTIIGIFADVSSEYNAGTSLPTDAIIPYRSGRETSYVRGDGKVIPIPPRPEIWIIPQNGSERRVLSGIQKILGKEKYTAVVSSSTWDFENSFGVQVRRERVAILAISSALTVLISVMTMSGLISLDIASRKRWLGIRRSVGATVRQVTWEYSSSLLRLFLASFLAACLLLALLLPFLSRFNMLGVYLSISRSPAEVLPLNLSITTVLVALGFLLVATIGTATIIVHRCMRGMPAVLLLSSGVERQNRTHMVFLALVTAVSVMAVFTSFSMMATLQKTMQDLVHDVPLQTTLIASSEFPAVSYTTGDYVAVRKTLLGKAMVGCRKTTPAMSSISTPSGSTIDLRVAGATEDFPAIYDMVMARGRFLTDADTGKCVVGAAIASSIHLQTGGTFMGDEIIGILKAHSPLIDHTVYVPLAEASAWVNPKGSSVTLLIKPLKETDRKEAVEAALELLVQRHPGSSRGVSNDLQVPIDGVVHSRESVCVLLSIFTFLAFLSALLYLSATFLIEGIQRTREIGIRRAVGAEQKTIQREFLGNGLFIGLTAIGIGVCVGSLTTFVIMKKEGMTFSLQPGLLFCFVLAGIVCLLLSLYFPARNAARITPAEALRRE